MQQQWQGWILSTVLAAFVYGLGAETAQAVQCSPGQCYWRWTSNSSRSGGVCQGTEELGNYATVCACNRDSNGVFVSIPCTVPDPPPGFPEPAPDPTPPAPQAAPTTPAGAQRCVLGHGYSTYLSQTESVCGICTGTHIVGHSAHTTISSSQLSRSGNGCTASGTPTRPTNSNYSNPYFWQASRSSRSTYSTRTRSTGSTGSVDTSTPDVAQQEGGDPPVLVSDVCGAEPYTCTEGDVGYESFGPDTFIWVCLDGEVETGCAADRATAFLDAPADQAPVSGIGIIHGWACEADTVAYQTGDAHGNWSEEITLPYGGERGDTDLNCGHPYTGFATVYNWNLLASQGHDRIRIFVDETVQWEHRVRVTTLGEEYVADAPPAMCTVDDWPEPDTAVTMEWQQNQQNFVITGVE